LYAFEGNGSKPKKEITTACYQRGFAVIKEERRFWKLETEDGS
jgi:hypothetical protein